MNRLIQTRLWFFVGLLILAFAGGGAVGWLLAAGGPEPAVAQIAADPPPAQAETPAAAPERPVLIPARVLARGDLDLAFVAYETFGPGRLALAAPAPDGGVIIRVVEFRDGSLQPVSEVREPMGGILDLTRGHLLNNGEPQAVVTTEKGFLILLGTERYLKKEEPGLERVFVGDWDGDGLAEAAYIHRQQEIRRVTVIQYGQDGRGSTLGSFEAEDFSAWSAVLERQGEPSLLIGAVRSEGGTQVVYHSLDVTQGLQIVARYPLRHREGEPIASFTGGEVAGRPTLAVSFKADPSYLELFDTASEGMPSRGRIILPDDDVYLVLLGRFTQRAESEVLAITPAGRWILYGLD